ncbi:DUF1501 domain-containing protein [Sulfitobacter sp. M368]|uniref:DUF1501 domain-containing protein n=1 Tax=Sulfitobacter sp. M368 TaxID=2867021 RepID=UPI0021A4DA23|nr:DUF1501 domain-containing protein [Sulfitobacter sp. M368]UWR15035.1 DUF1501 domain-containing protein [Sulfitobacter sp. M368]
MNHAPLSRRQMLARSGWIGCSLAASPLWTPLSLANAPWQGRLVVIILRGGMDGLDVVRPTGDPAFAALRPTLAKGDAPLDLDGYFALHPALKDLMPLWHREELGFVHAVSTPYRDKRSHFDGQDLLEAGTQDLGGAGRDGWLNRLMQHLPQIEAETAYGIGQGTLNLLAGTAPVANWTPEAALDLSPQVLRLAEQIMQSDPQMHAALIEAQMLSDGRPGAVSTKKGPAHIQVARFAADRLRGPARIAAFSLNGWDTHRAQARMLPRSLGQLSDVITTLKQDLGAAVWSQTAVVALTEFGRTARENGTGGTDHGTAGLMMMAGGAIRGGRVFGRWPGLGEQALYQERDLMPTDDVRAPVAWIMRGMTGLPISTLQDKVFPGLEMGADPKVVR